MDAGLSMYEIELAWKGKKYAITETQAFEVADKIERVVKLGELLPMISDPLKISYADLARTYSIMLDYVGVKAPPRECWQAILGSVKTGNKDNLATAALTSLAMILMDGAPKADGDEGKTEGHSSEPHSEPPSA